MHRIQSSLYVFNKTHLSVYSEYNDNKIKMIISSFKNQIQLSSKKIYSQKFLLFTTMFFLSLLFFSFQLFIPLRVFDEGIILTGAERVMNGELPYKDFWSIYPPGNFYLLSFMFDIFGTSVLTERIYGIVLNACLSTSIFIILYKCKIKLSIILTGFLLSLMLIGGIKLPTYPVFPSLLIINIAVIFFITYIDSGKLGYLILSGAFITFSTLFRHELGGFACISFLLCLMFINYIDNTLVTKNLLIFLLSILCAGLPFLLYFSSAIGFNNLYYHLIQTPASIMPNFRGLPYPTSISFTSLPFYIVPLILVLGVFLAIIITKRYHYHKLPYFVLLLLSVMGVLFMLQTKVRSDITHLSSPALLAIPVASILMHHIHNYFNNKQIKYFFMAISIVCFGLIVLIFFNNNFSVNTNNQNNNTLNRIKFTKVSNDLRKAVLFIKKNTNPEDYIFVGVENHDQFIINDTALYFLSERKYGTKYHEFTPGIVSSYPVQNEITGELKQNNVKVIVLAPRHWYEPNKSNIDYQNDILDKYIQENYIMTKQFGIYKILTLRNIKSK